MSQYVNFYLKKDNNWMLLADYNRNDKRYEVAESVLPYGKLVQMTPDIMEEIFDSIAYEFKQNKDSEERTQKEIEAIIAMPNPVEEKMEAITEEHGHLKWLKEELEELKAAENFYKTIVDIIDTGVMMYHVEDYVWAGIEACPPSEK